MNKIIKYIKENILKICIYILFSGICSILYYSNLKIANVDFFNSELATKYSIIFFVASFVFMIIIGAILILVSRNNIELHKKYFIIALTIGIVYLLIAPNFRGPDESFHFYRIYEISQGNFITPEISETENGSEMPTSIEKLVDYKGFTMNYHDAKEAIQIPLNANETKLYPNYYYNASVYSPIQYLPQTIGVFIGAMCNLNIYFIVTLGRIAGFIFWLIITTLAIKILPIKKLFAMIMFLTPISISFATTLSGDLITNTMVLLYISYITNICYTKRELKRKDYWILGITTIIVGLTKLVYLPLVLLLFVLPKEVMKNKKSYYLFIVGIILLSVTLSLLWLSQTNVTPGEYAGKSEEQLHFILKNPINYILTVIRTYMASFVGYITSFIGEDGTFHGVKIYEGIIAVYFFSLVCSLFNSENKSVISTKSRVLILMIATMTCGLIATALYIQFTAMFFPLYSTTVQGVQGRYFIPLVLMCILFFNKKHINIKDQTLINITALLQLPVLLTMFVAFLI